MSNDIKKKGFLERIPAFSLILIMAVLMVVGGALIPLLRISYHPSPEQGKRLTISFSWPGASQRVIEQEITSKVEGLVASVVGVEKTSSVSSQGNGSVTVVLKEKANVSAVRFEISSLLKQIAEKLPEGAGGLYLQGGNIGGGLRQNTRQVLSYIINADMDPANIKDYVERNIKPYLTQIDYVRDVSVGGAMPLYLDIEYNPIELQRYGLESNVIVSGLQNFLGQRSIVGDVDRIDRDGNKERITLLLETERLGPDIGKTPLATIDGKIIYLNDVAKFDYKKRQETSFYRINGLNTIYLSIFADTETNIIKASAEIRERMEKIQANLTDGFYVTLTNDAAKEVREELVKIEKIFKLDKNGQTYYLLSNNFLPITFTQFIFMTENGITSLFQGKQYEEALKAWYENRPEDYTITFNPQKICWNFCHEVGEYYQPIENTKTLYLELKKEQSYFYVE